MRAGNLYIQLGVTHLLADLLYHTHAAENGIGSDKGNFTAGSQASGYAGGVLLGNTNIHMLAGQLLGKGNGLAGLANVAVHHVYGLVFPSQSQNFFAIGVPGGMTGIFDLHHLESLLNIIHSLGILLIVWSHAVPLNHVLHEGERGSVKETPLPFTVCATMHLGLPERSARTASRTSRISFML